MRLPFHHYEVPSRIVTGAFILHSGLEKWNGPAEVAQGVHGMASTAYPFLKSTEPEQVLKMVAAGEIATGALLLAPFVPTRLAGLALTGFSAALLGLYAKVPGMRRPGSIWPTQQGIPISKDVWMLGIGLGLLASPKHKD